MSDKKGFTTCPDGHHCDNGSLCTENPYDEGAYYCDCEESFLNDAVAGLSCEHVATDYCTFNKEFSSISFCTNGGTCKVIVNPGSAHMGCDCPKEYEGEHCQFVQGTNVPENWPGGGNVPNYGSNSSDEKLSGGITAFIVLVVLGFVGAVGYMVYKKQRGSSGTSFGTTAVHSPEFQLEADGEVLKDAVKAGSGVNSNGNGTPSLDDNSEENGFSDAHETETADDQETAPEII